MNDEMKLKTLKDLKSWNDLDNLPDKLLSLKELKAEAIKWIKEFEKVSCDDSGMWLAKDTLISTFKEFFNITGDDLKNE